MIRPLTVCGANILASRIEPSFPACRQGVFYFFYANYSSSSVRFVFASCLSAVDDPDSLRHNSETVTTSSTRFSRHQSVFNRLHTTISLGCVNKNFAKK